MKFIHTADIHLDSPLVGVPDGKTRRYELLKAVANMSDYADNNGISAIVVAGDLFDDKFVSPQTIRGVAEIINGSKARCLCFAAITATERPTTNYTKFVIRLRFLTTIGRPIAWETSCFADGN